MCPYLSQTIQAESLPEDPLPDDQLILTGWREWIELPLLTGRKIKTKIDSGARTSSLHVSSYEFLNSGNQVRFQVGRAEPVEIAVHDRRIVRDSGGHEEERPFIRSLARLGGREWEIELSLTSRKGMLFPMLLGREALSGSFAINPDASYLFGRYRRSERKPE